MSRLRETGIGAWHRVGEVVAAWLWTFVDTGYCQCSPITLSKGFTYSNLIHRPLARLRGLCYQTRLVCQAAPSQFLVTYSY